MAFDATAMQRFVGGEVTLYVYKTADTNAGVKAGNYFNGWAAYLSVGDVIIVVTDTGTTPGVDILVVTSNDGTTVVVADLNVV